MRIDSRSSKAHSCHHRADPSFHAPVQLNQHTKLKQYRLRMNLRRPRWVLLDDSARPDGPVPIRSRCQLTQRVSLRRRSWRVRPILRGLRWWVSWRSVTILWYMPVVSPAKALLYKSSTWLMSAAFFRARRAALFNFSATLSSSENKITTAANRTHKFFELKLLDPLADHFYSMN